MLSMPGLRPSSSRRHSASRSTSRRRPSWLVCWRALLLLVGLAFASLDFAAERRISEVFDGRPHSARVWIEAASSARALFPLDRNLRHTSASMIERAEKNVRDDMATRGF